MRRAETDLNTQRARRPATLTAEELDWVTRAGADVRAIFNAPSTTWQERKQLLRCIIAEIVITIRKVDRQADLRIIWEGGSATEFTMALTRPGGHFRTTDEEIVALVRRLAAHYDDTTIAVILGRNQRRTATGLQFTKSRVKSLRVAKGIEAFAPVTVTPEDDNAMVVGINKAEQMLGVSKATVYRWLRNGFITGEQIVAGGPWRIRIDDDSSSQSGRRRPPRMGQPRPGRRRTRRRPPNRDRPDPPT